MTVEVQLTRGFVAVIDEADAEAVLAHKWLSVVRCDGRVDAGRSVRLADGRRSLLYLPRFLMGLDYGNSLQVDHIDFDPLNNRRANLRVVTSRQNAQHKRSQRGSTSRFVGVGWHVRLGRWHARIQVDGRLIHLGYFDTEVEAAAARDRYVIEHGLFHAINSHEGATQP